MPLNMNDRVYLTVDGYHRPVGSSGIIQAFNGQSTELSICVKFDELDPTINSHFSWLPSWALSDKPVRPLLHSRLEPGARVFITKEGARTESLPKGLEGIVQSTFPGNYTVMVAFNGSDEGIAVYRSSLSTELEIPPKTRFDHILDEPGQEKRERIIAELDKARARVSELEAELIDSV